MVDFFKCITIFLTYSFFGYGQISPVEISKKHIQVSGTNIFMIPPNQFSLSTNFKGFQNPNDLSSMIMILEIPGPFLEVTKGYNSETLINYGIKLNDKKIIKFFKYDALFIQLDQDVNGTIFSKHILVYGDEKSSIIINGSFLKDSKELGDQIKQSILTVVIDSELDYNDREQLNYSVDESVGFLKLKAVIENQMLFNRDLKTPTESDDEATLMTSKCYYDIKSTHKELFCISNLKKYPEEYSLIDDKGVNEIEIANLKGFELYAKNNNVENKEMYQVILFDSDGFCYILAGTYKFNSKQAILDLQKIIDTFHIKPFK